MNKSKIATSEVCQKCGKCCQEFFWIEEDWNYALRLKLLKDAPIKVEEHTDERGKKCWFIRISRECAMLKYEDGKYSCSIYDDKEIPRPLFCEEYPDNILKLFHKKIHSQICPLLKSDKGDKHKI